MKLRLLTVTAFLGVLLCGAAAPLDCAPLNFHNYKIAPYIQAAVTLQGMGREAACQAMLTRTNDAERGISVVVLCRMLFLPRGTNEFLNPVSYGFVSLWGTNSVSNDRRDLIYLVDGVPLKVVLNGFDRGGGLSEDADAYLRYCMQNCDWNPVKFRVPTAKEKAAAVDKLGTSGKVRQRLGGWPATGVLFDQL